MIVVNTEKDITTGKQFVSKWRFVPKEIATSIEVIPGFVAKFDSNTIPMDFYKHSNYYYVDGNRLRRFFKK